MDRFQDNFSHWLKTCFPDEVLLLDLEAINRPGDIHFCVSDSGVPNLRKGDFFLHEQSDPVREAEEWFSALQLKHVHVLFIYGIGLGYYYEAARNWLKEEPERYLVFLEDDPEVMHGFLQSEKCEGMLNDPQVIITLLSPSLDFKTIQYSRLSNLFAGAPFVYTGLNSYRQHHAHLFYEHQATVSFMTRMGTMLSSETMSHGIVFFRNFFFNALELSHSYDGMALKGKFEGVPAIICGAGPSLDKNIQVLSTLMNRALIFAGGTALNALNARGVMPHFGVGIDPNPDQFTRLIRNHAYETPFLYRCRMRHDALQMVHGDRLYINGSGGYQIGKWLEKQLGNEDPIELEEGYNVLNFSVLFAHLMGCNPIICVGVDLAYSEGQSYASGVASHPLHNLKGNFRTKYEEEELIPKKDIHGFPIFTLWKWIAESMWYTYFFDTYPDTTLINATEGGIGFPKVPNLTLQEVKDKYLQKEYDLATRIHGEIQNSGLPASFNRDNIRKLIGRLHESLVKCGNHCCTLIELLAKKQKESDPSFLKDEITKEHNLFIQEEAYEVMLQKFYDGYAKSQELERRRLKVEENKITPEEFAQRSLELDLKKYRFVKDTAFLNSTIMDQVLELNQEREKKEANPEEIEALKKGYPIPPPFEMEPDSCENVSETVTTDRLYYPSGALKLETAYLGNLLHGPSRFYSEKGILLATAHFLQGKQEGEARTYYPNGSLHSIGKFHQGLKADTHRYFYPDGILKSVLPYKEGKLDGEVLLYASNGTLFRRLHFLQGRQHGEEQIWNQQGKLWIESQYADDKPIGVSRMWHPNGVLAKEVHYDSNSKWMEEKKWDSNGIAIEEQTREDYFDQVNAQTDKLTASINEMVSTLSALTPAYEHKIQETVQTISPENSPSANIDLHDDLEKLQKELANLQSLDNAIKIHLSGPADNPIEAIWKTPASRQEIEKQFNDVQSQMNQEMEKIQQGIKSMLGFLQQNKQDRQDRQDIQDNQDIQDKQEG